jgi:hypothetical protein
MDLLMPGFVAKSILVTHLFSTLAMVGVIWFVQIVHYPLFSTVGIKRFRKYERRHQQRTTVVVAPLMLLESSTAVLLVFLRPVGVEGWLPWMGGFLLIMIWASTFFWQVPYHTKLAREFQHTTHRRLVRSNWLRTVAWTARGGLVCAMCWQAMGASE